MTVIMRCALVMLADRVPGQIRLVYTIRKEESKMGTSAGSLRKLRYLIGVACTGFLLAGPSLAQSTFGSITGIVADPSGRWQSVHPPT